MCVYFVFGAHIKTLRLHDYSGFPKTTYFDLLIPNPKRNKNNFQFTSYA